MAPGSLATGLHSFPAQSILYKKNDFGWERRKDSCPTSLFKSSQSIQSTSYTCQLENSRIAWRSSKAVRGEGQPREEDDGEEDSSMNNSSDDVSADLLRKRLEKIVGDDDATFSGKELATLIRNKYGRSYDVQLIKKEFMGRQLLALNVMWKYREQRSFPLTEEEYLLHLDNVANNLRCWGAVSYIRNSLAKTKERPRIGKAVSIFIDLDESGGRANEWIYR